MSFSKGDVLKKKSKRGKSTKGGDRTLIRDISFAKKGYVSSSFQGVSYFHAIKALRGSRSPPFDQLID